MQVYKYILFDWDGTLAKTPLIWHAAIKAAVEKHGHTLDNLRYGADYALFQKDFEAAGHDDAAEIVADAWSNVGDMYPDIELYPSAQEVLDKLKELGCILGLVTTSNHVQIDPLLIKYNLDRLFDVIVCGEDVQDAKPHPEPILLAVSKLNADKDRTLMVGDSEADLKSAAHAGVDSTLIFPDEHQPFYDFDDLQKLEPNYIVRDLRELLELI